MARVSKSKSGATGRLSRRPSPNDGLIPQTLAFVRKELPNWRDDPRRPQSPSEKNANSTLCDFLDTRARNDHPMVRFKHEDPQTGTCTIDIGVHSTEEDTVIGAVPYSIYDSFMVIEAKRLPAPKKDREREYVTGPSTVDAKLTGGIQRFKLGLHGAKVLAAAIVGYIEDQLPSHWHQMINQWIADLVAAPIGDGCVWKQSDALEDLTYDDKQGVAVTESNHQRTGACRTKSIRLHHLWVVMS